MHCGYVSFMRAADAGDPVKRGLQITRDLRSSRMTESTGIIEPR